MCSVKHHEGKGQAMGDRFTVGCFFYTKKSQHFIVECCNFLERIPKLLFRKMCVTLCGEFDIEKYLYYILILVYYFE